MENDAAVEDGSLGHDTFCAAVRRDIDGRRLIPDGAGVLAAVSGGADSTALLLCLAALAPTRGWMISAAHFNHHMRADSDSDERFVSDLCSRLGIPVFTGRAEALSYGASEEAAREQRLHFVREACSNTEAEVVALGHTSDDRVETVLMNIIRGTGLTGLCGIRWINPPFVRPLLGRTRSEALAFLRRREQQWVEDRSNMDVRWTRNRVRHQLLPLLEEQFNPAVRSALLRLAECASDDDEHLEAEAAVWLERAMDAMASRGGKGIRLLRSEVMKSPTALARRMVRLALGRTLGGASDIDLQMVERVLEAARTGSPGEDIGLGVRLHSTEEHVVLALREMLEDAEPFDYVLPEAGSTHIAECCCRVDTGIEQDSREVALERIRLKRTSLPLHARSWTPGDKMRPKGLGGSKKLQDIFMDAKVPRRERGRVPVICAGEEILWVPGLAVAEGAEDVSGGISVRVVRVDES